MASVSATTSHNDTGTALTRRFTELRAAHRKALVCYVTAGHPDPASSVALLRALQDAGADVLEVGVPFSDPMADGPVIQRSSQLAIEHGVNLSRTLDIVAEAAVSIPVVLFSYLNPVIAAGSDVLSRAADAGVSGILITDLPVGADPEREEWLGSNKLDFVRLVAPTTPAARMKEIGSHGGGFVYLISRLGVTGERDALAVDLPQTIARLRGAVSLPICVGFGISTPEQAREAAMMADGVVVGSAIVRAAGHSVGAAAALVAAMRTAIDAPAA
jgi:tryptophan synthase alpha chain